MNPAPSNCPNPAQAPEQGTDYRSLWKDAEQWRAAAEAYRTALSISEGDLQRCKVEMEKWRRLAIGAVAAAKSCLLLLPVSDIARWQAIKDVENRLGKLLGEIQ